MPGKIPYYRAIELEGLLEELREHIHNKKMKEKGLRLECSWNRGSLNLEEEKVKGAWALILVLVSDRTCFRQQ